MADPGGRAGFWASLPGVLAGLAAVITAVAGLVLGLYQYGVLGSKHDTPPASTRGSRSTEAPTASGSPQDRQSAAAPRVDAPRAGPRPGDATVQITSADGSVTTVYADGFQHRQTSRQLVLRGGQAIPFESIRAIDVERVSTDQANVRVTLAGGQVVEGAIDSGLYPFSFVGRNDVGEFSIRVEHLRRIVFGPG